MRRLSVCLGRLPGRPRHSYLSHTLLGHVHISVRRNRGGHVGVVVGTVASRAGLEPSRRRVSLERTRVLLEYYLYLAATRQRGNAATLRQCRVTLGQMIISGRRTRRWRIQ